MIEETPTGGLRRVDPDPNLIEFSEGKGFIKKEETRITIVLGDKDSDRIEIVVRSSGSIRVISVCDGSFLSVHRELKGEDAAAFIRVFQGGEVFQSDDDEDED